MGEVYRAQDTKLGRDVAIKVLPEEFSRDKERLERFEREARLLAQLNHANVATLHGLEEHDEQQFLVMEMVEGETLAERIARGPIPRDEALPLFIELAEGLEAAHGKGIIHRDFKPANIKIGPDGKPKILDFGLAKAFVAKTESAADASQSPTLTKGTALGAIMGTAGYMSPEQARGRTVDKRSDIWAYGCCLYESLTGQRAFAGHTVTDVLAAVIGNEPDLSELSDEVPWQIPRLLRRCFEKNLRERAPDIGMARLEIKEALASPLRTIGALPGRLAVSRRTVLLMAASMVVLAALIRPFPDVDEGRWQVSTNGGTEASWALDGRELFYREGDKMMRVELAATSAFAYKPPQVLFEGRYDTHRNRNYDVARDGRFLMVKDVTPPNQASARKHLVLVQNWLEELERLVPTDN